MISRAPNRTAIAYRLASAVHDREAAKWQDLAAQAKREGRSNTFELATATRYYTLADDALEMAVAHGLLRKD